MRLWSIHPKYLDRAGILALWRESLLARKVLQGKSKGYKNHSQLRRFRNCLHPEKAIANYLFEIWKESSRRGYNFDRKKIGIVKRIAKIAVTSDQIRYEFEWLSDKLKSRNPLKYKEITKVKKVEPHALFKIKKGQVEGWEKIKI